MVLNPHRYEATLHPREDRHARAGCLMAATFFLPLLANKLNSAILFGAFFIYIALIVPMLANYFTVGAVFSFCKLLAKTSWQVVEWLVTDPIGKIVGFVSLVWDVLVTFQHFYFELDAFRTTSNQVVFFMLAEKYLCPKDRLACLYALLFYTILAYLKKSLKTRQWAQVFNASSVSDLLRMTSTFLAVRLGKAVATTAVLMMFTMQFNDHEPNFTFITLTVFYFALTQFPENKPDVLSGTDLPSALSSSASDSDVIQIPGVNFVVAVRTPDFEEIRALWLPLVAKLTALAMSMVIMALSWRKHYVICAVGIYTNLYAPVIELYETYVTPLAERTRLMARFRLATKAELMEADVCPICLEQLGKLARVTPCNHIFHGNCLYRCLKVTNLCPMCKRSISNAVRDHELR